MSLTLLTSKEIPQLIYQPSREHFDETWRKPLGILLGLGRAAGADFLEFFLERTNYLSCLGEEDIITAVSPSLSSGAGVRIFKGKADCYVSTNNISFKGLRIALEKGLSILDLSLPYSNAYVPEVNLEILRDHTTHKDKESWLPECIQIE